ncbi:hypothetical protein B0H65DRAFT_528943 [Neurospora tetraspora]|uniref:Uncharacterized protein n=1 Tax=Neurospora tetraspora TaxID=94610 RepID=A0AAE0JAL7_9PEZI|nr:hypothetical protein B0H65DRAFT_528943 [Neurospora tetraspora]
MEAAANFLRRKRSAGGEKGRSLFSKAHPTPPSSTGPQRLDLDLPDLPRLPLDISELLRFDEAQSKAPGQSLLSPEATTRIPAPPKSAPPRTKTTPIAATPTSATSALSPLDKKLSVAPIQTRTGISVKPKPLPVPRSAVEAPSWERTGSQHPGADRQKAATMITTVNAASTPTTPTAASNAKPWNAPLPPLPPMSIPRRPLRADISSPTSPSLVTSPTSVAASLDSPTLKPIAASRPASPPRSGPVPAPAPAPASASAPAKLKPSVSPNTSVPVSPAGSLSSILWAHSDGSSGSSPRSSTNSTHSFPDSKEPNPSAASSRLVGQVSSSNHHEQKREEDKSRKFAQSERELPPAPPAPPVKEKDSHLNRQRPETPPKIVRLQTQSEQASTGAQIAPISINGSNTSPQQGELWRRRSVKSEKNLVVADLVLDSSNGSTAESAQIQSHAASRTADAQPTVTPPLSPGHVDASPPAANNNYRAPVHRTTTANALTGRNIRPSASRQQVIPQVQDTMGQAKSHLRKKSRDDTQRAGTPAEKAVSQPTSETSNGLPAATTAPSVARHPAPDYGQYEEVKQPTWEPDAPSVRQVPSTNTQGGNRPAIQRKAIGGYDTQVRSVNDSNLAPSENNAGLSVRSPVGLPASPVANRGRPVERPPAPNAAPFPTRTTSKTGNGYRPANNPTPQIQVQDEYHQYSNGTVDHGSVSESGSAVSVETLKPPRRRYVDNEIAVISDEEEPEEQSWPERTDNPGVALFLKKKNWYAPLPADGVLDAPPLTDKHYRCLTSHKFMTPSRQRYNRIACRTCGERQHVDCFICSACSLNICLPCAKSLKVFGGNLKQLLRHVEESRQFNEEDENGQVTPGAQYADHNGFSYGPPAENGVLSPVEAH